ncbi:MAG: hypothetical protein ACAI25_10385, partial [Planctomycetota bacterium]
GACIGSVVETTGAGVLVEATGPTAGFAITADTTGAGVVVVAGGAPFALPLDEPPPEQPRRRPRTEALASAVRLKRIVLPQR